MSYKPKQDVALSSFFNRVPVGLRPNFPSKFFSREAYRWAPDSTLRATSYLDGVRGLAAFLVVIHHWADIDFVHTTSGHGFYNYDDPSVDRELVKLPIIRLLFNGGHAMVPIFFVISGFSLAFKPIEYIRTQQFDKLLANMSSSIIRRAPRLCLPPIVMTFFVMVAIRLGFYSNRPLPQPLLERFPSVFTQIADWFWDVTYIFDPFSWDFVIWIKYQPHTWTLNTELHGSKWVYMVLLASARLRQTPRLVCLCWWCLYCIWHVQYWTFLFCSGIVIAEIHYLTQDAINQKDAAPQYRTNHETESAAEQSTIANDASEQGPIISPLRSRKSDEDIESKLSTMADKGGEAFSNTIAFLGSSPSTEKYIAWVLLFIGLFLCSAPPDEPQTKYMFWRTIWSWNPIPVTHFLGSNDHDYFEKTQRIFLSIGATTTVFAITRLPVLKRWFEIPAMQYLGKISFSLYLVHGPIIMTVGWTVIPTFWWLFGIGTYWPPVQWDGMSPGPIYGGSSRFAIELAHIIGLVVMLPIMLWLSDLFEKYIDQPILRMTKKVFGKYSIRE